MNGFVLHLQSAARYERIAAVESFVGQDASGSFGILPGRARLMTVLSEGLMRFRVAGEDWQYLACPGAVLHFTGRDLFLNTRRYLRDTDYQQVSARLTELLAEEETRLASVKDNLQALEKALMERLRRMEREGS